jgi:4-hydroxy-4-methyl-2-oxoglutarate aldolase
MSTTSRSSEDIGAALARLGSATVGESGGQAADRRLRPAWAGAAVAAPAYPVGCTPGDNLAVHVAVTTAPRGSVLAVDVGRVVDRGYWGEVLTTAAEVAGLTGLVLDGGVRDVAALEAHGFPVFSATIALTGATKDKPGTVGSPVRVGGVSVALGDWVVADVDGVAFVRGDAVDAVLAAGAEREAKEAGFFDALKAGSTTVGLLGLDASLVRQDEGR